MADAVTVKTLVDNADQIVVHLTCISDASGEAAVQKIDKSAIAAAQQYKNPSTGVVTAATEAASLDLSWIRWNIQGFTSVKLLWDHTTDDVMVVLSGAGYEDFMGPGDARGTATLPCLVDPRSAGGTGDVLLTSTGASATATYDITAGFRKATV
jgi:hypothetical protein